MDLGTFCAGLPVREISSQADLEQYLLSDTFQRFYAFVKALSESVVGLKLSDCPTPSANVHWAATLLEQMSTAVSNYPPIETNSRFGNAAFRDWLDAVRVMVPKEHFDKKIPLSDEVSSYLLNSLGDYQRIDYGTGHEAHFIAWLYCLCASETGPFFSIQEHCSLVLSLFIRYMRLMRLLQQTYWLEPAGSHGVWGLDDYHFLPFLFGASQLINHPHLRPKSIHDSDLVEEYVSEYLY
jgi:serine/threonine-protein phosphatase 2A activator